MAINPETTTTVKVSELASAGFNTTDLVPHEVGGYLKKGTLQDLATFIGGIIDVEGSVAFKAVNITDGQTLPATTTEEFILVGPGTYPNVGGGSPVTTTEALSALVSNGTYWFIGVEIPITASGTWGAIAGELSDQTDLQDALDLKADLVDGKVPSSQLPSYVDDVVEVANYAALPSTGETGKIYITIDNNKVYRWSGSAYIEIAENNAVWGLIEGTLSSQTDLNTALGLKVPYTGATGNVDLGTHKLTASDLVVNHTSGSGAAATISKGGSGEALTVTKSSGSGNAASVLGGVTLLDELHLNTDLADSYIASAATWNAKQSALTFSSPLVNTSGTISIPAASGSVNGYLSSTDWTTFNTKQTALNGTGFVKISGTTISYDNSTYVPTSRTLTINGTAYDLSADRSWTISAGVTGTGTTNYIPKFTGSTALGNSLIYDNGTNVGIGTTSPTDGKLQVAGSSQLGNTIAQTYFGVGAAATKVTSNGAYAIGVDAADGSTERMRITSGGLVGIGEGSPSEKLTIASGNIKLNSFQFNSGDYRYIGTEYATGNGNNKAEIRFAIDGGDTFTRLQFHTANGAGNIGERMRITSGGNVGIGTTSPSSKLHIGGVGSAIAFDTTGASGTSIIQTVEDYKLSLKSNRGGTTEIKIGDSNLEFLTNSSERMRITSGGNVLIGTTTDAGAKLQVNGHSILGGALNSTWAVGVSNTGTTDAHGMYVNIGASSTGVPFAVYKNFSALFTVANSGAATFSSTVTATGFFNSSDNRLKDLIDYDYNVSDIKPITYFWKDGRDNKKHVGYSAQEVQKVMPDAVNEDEKGFLSVNYVEVLVAQVELLNNRMAEMQKEIELLKSK